MGAIFSLILGLGLAVASIGYAQLPAVTATRQPVTNAYHGVAVEDDYQWLEEATNPAVRDWTRQQNERMRAYFDRLKFKDGLEQELSELISDASASYSVIDCKGGNIFALRFKPPAQQPVLVRLKSLYPPALRRVVFLRRVAVGHGANVKGSPKEAGPVMARPLTLALSKLKVEETKATPPGIVPRYIS